MNLGLVRLTRKSYIDANGRSWLANYSKVKFLKKNISSCKSGHIIVSPHYKQHAKSYNYACKAWSKKLENLLNPFQRVQLHIYDAILLFH